MSNTVIIVTVLIVVIVAYIFYNYRKMKNTPAVANSPKIRVLSDKNFQHQIRTGIYLVDFWADWCLPCKMMAPVLNDVAEELEGNAWVGKLDVETNRVSASKYNIRNIPTMVLYKNGKEIDRFVGAKTKDFLLKQINKVK
ncbi:MAG TPA: thioredoxin [Bacteroidales bacterium]|nr:thioredoxin [Bacteroidales bacterium]